LDSLYSKKITSYDEAQKLFQKLKTLEIDSLRSKFLVKLTRFAFIKKEWNLFHQYRQEFILNKTLSDFHKDLGKIYHYSALYFDRTLYKDSAYYYYYKAYKAYEKADDEIGLGKTLLNISIIQKNLRDYSNSEENSNRAIYYLKKNNKVKDLASAYNNLGLIYSHNNELDKSLLYHEKALDLRKSLNQNQTQSLNNIGLSLIKQEEYPRALEYFSKAIEMLSSTSGSGRLYPKLLDNYGYTLLLEEGPSKQSLDSITKAYSIRTDSQNEEDLIMSHIHLAKFFFARGDKRNARNHADSAENYSKKAASFSDYIESSNFLLSLYDSTEITNKRNWLIHKRDSLETINDAVKDALYRIRFKVDEKDAIIRTQTSQIEQINSTKLGLVISIISILLFFVGVLFFRRTKRRRLEKAFAQGFHQYLVEKYKLTKENLDFWMLWASGLNQKQLSAELFISEDAVKSRRKSLKQRIRKVQKIDDKFTQVMGTNLFNQEKERFQKTIQS
jgi:tetratricopeptide (TPR) repeat protein